MPFVVTPIDGGLDLVTAPQSVQPGRMLDCQNYEVARRRGISRMDGYEPYDGGPSPSYFSIIKFTATRTGNNTTKIFVGANLALFATSSDLTNNLYSVMVVTATSNSYNSGSNTTTFNVTGYITYSPVVGHQGVIYRATKNFQGFINYQNVTVLNWIAPGPFVLTAGSGGTTTIPFVSAVSGTAAAYLAQIGTYFSSIQPTIQQVPGQNSVNGMFWIKDKLYAVRDYLAFSFTLGSVRPNPGDVLYQGASLGAATWTGIVAKVVTDSGTTWGASPGTATGSIMVYNTTNGATGTAVHLLPSNGVAINNSTQGNAATCTAGAQGNSTAAGLWLAIGGRGSTLTTYSWQWCDLGYNIAYQSGTFELPDMNVALTNQPASTSTTATQSLNTQFRTAGTVQGWTNVGAYPGVLTDAYTVDGGFAYYNFNGDLGYGGYLTLTNFGFTDADIPVASAITGIELQVQYGGFWPNTTPSTIPLTIRSLSLIGASGSDQPDLGTPNTTFKDAPSGSSNDPTQGGNYNFRLLDLGAPATGSIPPGRLGYNGIAAADVKAAGFGVKIELSTSPVTFNQNVYAGIDFVKVRFAYLPAGNGIYFWNPNCVCYPNGGTPTAGLTDGVTVATNTTVTSATGNFVVRGVTAGMIVVIPGAGVAAATLVTTVASVTDATHIVLTTAPSTSIPAGATIKIFQVPVRAQVVKHYRTSGITLNPGGTAAGQIYLQFYNTWTSAGKPGGPPPRPIAANEQIRSFPGGGLTPDGGVFDASIQYALTSSTHQQNVMDWSALLAPGAPQPDGSTAPASKYQSITKNFYASSGLEAIYGVSGGGPAFYYDGVKMDASGNSVVGNFSRILTGLPTQFETPRGVCAHQGHLMLTYFFGSVQQSDSANVLNYDPTMGNRDATSYGFSERVTGAASVNGDSLAVWTQSTVQMIQGQVSAGNAYESIISPTSGGIEYSIQPMANFMYADFRGITMIGATQKYGNFEVGHVSSEVSPFLIPRLQTSAFFESTNTGFINSVLIRNKNMARYFFADGRAMSLTFLVDGENPQFSIQRYFYSDGTTPLTWDVVQAFTESTGRDRIFGAVNDGSGIVYELERSNTFNGGVIPAYAILVPDTAQMAYQQKVFSGINVFGQAQDYATFQVSRANNYNTPAQATGGNIISETFGSAAAQPTGNTLPFVSYGTSGLQIEGTAIGIRFDSGTNGDPSASVAQFPHTIQALAYTVTPANAKQQ